MNHFLANYSIHPTDADAPFTLQNLEKDVPFDKNLLLSGSESYQITLKYYYELISKRKLSDSITLTQDTYLKFSFKDISDYEIPSEFKEFMLTDLLMTNLIDKIPANFDYFFGQFKQNYPNSQYITIINNRLDKFMKMINNQAFEITGKDIHEKNIKLSDFKGKIVYLDFWATWCGLCIKEMPFSVKLQEKFKKKNEIIFLFVSIDQDINKWKIYLKKHPKFTGIHIILKKEDMDEVKNSYAIFGIPRYILNRS